MTSPVRAAAVVPAAGCGERMAGGSRKQYLRLGGEAILLRSLRAFLEHPVIHWVIVVLPAEDLASPPVALPEGVIAVAGGDTRQGSVRRGLEAVPESADLVLIHDAARPLVSRAVIDRVIEAAADGVGVVPAVPLADTLKRVDGDGTVTATIDRSSLWLAQTPQAFPRRMIMEAHRSPTGAASGATDDAALVERWGGRVVVVDGDVGNIKITTPPDLALAETILATRSGS
jgi:2-C-methyl-D-erythritol 4-phosphate cytidylyltransferase